MSLAIGVASKVKVERGREGDFAPVSHNNSVIAAAAAAVVSERR